MHSKIDNFYNNLKLGYMKKGIREINKEQQGKSKLGRNIVSMNEKEAGKP